MSRHKAILYITSRVSLHNVCESGKYYLNRRHIKYGNVNRTLHKLTNKTSLETPTKDPKVEALRDKIIYCDYLDGDKVSMRHEFYVQKQILAKRQTIIDRRRKMSSKDPYSIAVKNCISDETDESITPMDTDALDMDECDKMLVHMPYAQVDEYNPEITRTNSIEQDSNDKDFSEFSMLNQKYKALYEEYLKEKDMNKESNIDFDTYVTASKIGVLPKGDLSKVPFNWMTDYEQYDDSLEHPWLINYGTPDPNSTISNIPCGGCGAALHCKDVALPGYLPSELFAEVEWSQLRTTICQRCNFLKHYNTALEVKVSAEDYPKLLKVIKKKKCAVIVMVDLTDFPCSIWSKLKTILHSATVIFLVGNKIDLLPQDSYDFYTRVKDCLVRYFESTGIEAKRIAHVALISAKSGYGIEGLINKLHSLWAYQGDVYMIGCTNVGKSSLFNALLNSDYCKTQAIDLVQRATISPWPGTTLNLLKFPILNPRPQKLYLRVMRLQAEREMRLAEEQQRKEKYRHTRNIEYVTLQGKIGRSFTVRQKKLQQHIIDPFTERAQNADIGIFGLNEAHPDYIHSRWCYDTPGTVQPDQILDLLTTEELVRTLPQKIISPRTFILHERQTIFLGGLARLDCLEAALFIRCTVFASDRLPVTICYTIDADEVYEELLHTEAFVVPINAPERLKLWPKLASKEMNVTGIGKLVSVADIVFSNAGWLSITPPAHVDTKLKAWTPEGRGLYLRTPPLLPHSVRLRGARVQNTPAYRYGKRVFVKYD